MPDEFGVQRRLAAGEPNMQRAEGRGLVEQRGSTSRPRRADSRTLRDSSSRVRAVDAAQGAAVGEFGDEVESGRGARALKVGANAANDAQLALISTRNVDIVRSSMSSWLSGCRSRERGGDVERPYALAVAEVEDLAARSR